MGDDGDMAKARRDNRKMRWGVLGEITNVHGEGQSGHREEKVHSVHSEGEMILVQMMEWGQVK